MIHLLFCGNDGVFDGVLTCMLSILHRSRGDEPYHVHLFTMDVSHLQEKYRPITQEHLQLLPVLQSQVFKGTVRPVYR